MNLVKFPGLNIEFNISRVAFKIFGIEIYWYAIIIVCAMVLAIIMFKKRDGLYEIKFNDIIDLSIVAIPIAIICARIYYIIFNLEYYMLNPKEILNIRNGGLAIYGAVIGGIITCFIFCKKKKIKLLDLIDYVAPGLVLGQAIGRWGNFINVEAYGTATNSFLRMGIMENGKYVEVHPTFLYESIFCFIIFVILLFIKNKRKFSGQIACTYFILYSFERFFIESLRVDSLMVGNIRISQIVSVIIFIMCSFIYIINIYKYKKASKK